MKDKSLAKVNQEVLELRKENEALQQTVTMLLEENERLRNLPVVRNVDSNTITLPTVQRMQRSPEQEIIEEQILHLDTISRGRMLSLEETRTLDLLIKNKKLLEPKSDHEPDWKKVSDATSESDLLRLADVNQPEQESRETESRADTSSEDTLA
jgi:hypothetical protein